jgi:hypothetical protein
VFEVIKHFGNAPSVPAQSGGINLGAFLAQIAATNQNTNANVIQRLLALQVLQENLDFHEQDRVLLVH